VSIKAPRQFTKKSITNILNKEYNRYTLVIKHFSLHIHVPWLATHIMNEINYIRPMGVILYFHQTELLTRKNIVDMIEINK
jgi:hypothetical protein